MHLKYADVEKMRYDSETDFHEVLTLKTHEAVKDLAYKYKNKGYSFADELVYVYEKNKEQTEHISKLEKENEKLRRQLGKKKYDNRLSLLKNRKKKSKKK